MFVPSVLLKQLYTFGSLENTDRGIQFAIKNRLKDATLTELIGVKVNGTPVPSDDLELFLGDGDVYTPDTISTSNPVDFPLRRTLHVRTGSIDRLDTGKHEIEISFRAKPFGKLSFTVEDTITEEEEEMIRIPRDESDDYSEEAIKSRQDWVKENTGKELEHTGVYSIDPHTTKGNCEHFTGVAQIPLGVAGPLTVDGEHAQGDFVIPMATTEGTPTR